MDPMDLTSSLPALSRLGLWRFTRLNDAGWTLDGCEPGPGADAHPLLRLFGNAAFGALLDATRREQLHQQVRQQLAERGHYQVQHRLATAHGDISLLEFGEPADDQTQRLHGYLLPLDAVAADLTDTAELCRSALEQSAEAFLLVDINGRVVFSNPRFEAITQYSPSELQGRSLDEFSALASLPELVRTALRQKPDNDSWQIEFRSQRKSLEPYWGHMWVSRVRNAEGQTTHLLGLCEDVTLNKLNYQRQAQQTLRDSLTGLGNRPYFIDRLEQQLSEAPDAPFSLLLMDIDNFKRINETLGHETGDKVLTSLSRRLRNALGPKACLARFASNEFAALLDAADMNAEEVARQLLHLLSRPLFVANQLINVTASIGLVRNVEPDGHAQQLMQQAGLALHKAKTSGKNRWQMFTPELDAEAHRRQFIEQNLRHAIERNELLLYYQPKLCLKTDRLTGLEALLRWQHPIEGMFPPDAFIGLAEETGLIVPIGKWVVREACRMLHRLDAAGMGEVRIAINLSPRQFHDTELVNALRDILAQERIEASRLELELTESLLLDASQANHEQLHQLKALGFTLAMDDFGTGYSSLSYLKKFPLDTIKIDRSFVKDIPGNQDDMEITAAVIAMAHKLRLRVVAEGIETQEQLNFLRRQRCDTGQGYLFDRPIDGRELLERLRGYTLIAQTVNPG